MTFTCPPGYCDCSQGFDMEENVGCLLNYTNPDEICIDTRTGTCADVDTMGEPYYCCFCLPPCDITQVFYVDSARKHMEWDYLQMSASSFLTNCLSSGCF